MEQASLGAESFPGQSQLAIQSSQAVQQRMSPFSGTSTENKQKATTVYLPRINDAQNTPLEPKPADQIEVKKTELMNQTFSNRTQPIFDGLFYKRLQHIERVLDEDPLELEKFKNYFT